MTEEAPAKEKKPRKKKAAKAEGVEEVVIKTLDERLQDVASDISGIEKAGYNDHFRYEYVQETDVKRALRPLFSKHGLTFHFNPVVEGSPMVVNPVAKELRKGFMSTVQFPVQISCPATKEEKTYTCIGFGSDTSDKGIYKAITGGIKYWLLNQFLIPTGEDPERSNDGDSGNDHDNEPPAAPPKPAAKPSGPPPGAPTGPPSGGPPKVVRKKRSEAPAGPKDKPAEEPPAEDGIPQGILSVAKECGLGDEDLSSLIFQTYGTDKLHPAVYDSFNKMLKDVLEEKAFLVEDDEGNLAVEYDSEE